MNPKHVFIGPAVLSVALLAVPPAWADPPGWLHTFDDNTFEGLVPWDYISWQTDGAIVTFFPTTATPCPSCSPALRLSFTSSIDRAVGLFSEYGTEFSNANGGVSAKLLIKTSTNPYMFATPDKNSFFVALAVNMDPQFSSDKTGAHFKGYWVYVGDAGANPNANPPTNNRLEMAIQYLDPSGPHDLCSPTPGSIRFDPFDPTKDWWMRFEALDDGAGAVLVRGRIWPDDGTPEPSTWDVYCVDTVYKYTSGIVGFGAEQRLIGPAPYTSYIDLDNVSASLVPEYNCYNLIDDDLDSLTDCADPDCAASAACACNDPFADADGDGDVDQADFAVFQACFSGAGGGLFADCECFDRDDMNADQRFNPPDDGDGDVDNTDLDKFEACASGPGIAADQTCDNANY